MTLKGRQLERELESILFLWQASSTIKQKLYTIDNVYITGNYTRLSEMPPNWAEGAVSVATWHAIVSATSRISKFLSTSRRETLRFSWKKNSLFPKGLVIKYFFLYSKTNQKQILKNAPRFQRQHQASFNWALWSRAIAVNIWRHSFQLMALTVNSSSLDVM